MVTTPDEELEDELELLEEELDDELELELLEEDEPLAQSEGSIDSALC